MAESREWIEVGRWAKLSANADWKVFVFHVDEDRSRFVGWRWSEESGWRGLGPTWYVMDDDAPFWEHAGEPTDRWPGGEIGARATAWRVRQGLDKTPQWVAVKAGEEYGEVMRALVGEHEQRPARGDLVQEIAQTVIVLASLLALTHPEADLLEAVAAEMERLGA